MKYLRKNVICKKMQILAYTIRLNYTYNLFILLQFIHFIIIK